MSTTPQPFSSISAIETHAQTYDDVISLAQGTMRAGPIAGAIKAHMQQQLATTATDHYTAAAGLPALRTALANYWEYGLTSDNVMVTHGAMGALTLVLHTLLNAGDTVMVPEPTYAAYHEGLRTKGIKTTWVSLYDDTDDTPTIIDDAHLFSRITAAYTRRTKALILANPGNPTGMVLSKELLEKLIAWCEKKQVYLITDEVYRTYVYHGTHTSSAPYVSTSSRVIMIDSFSKWFAMSGWRVGYVIAPAALISQLMHTQHIMINSVNTFGQHAAQYALSNPTLAEPLHALLKKNHTLVSALLPALQTAGLHAALPDAGFYLLAHTTSHAQDTCTRLLTTARVATVPGALFGPSAHNSVRLCFARPYDQLHEALTRLIEHAHV